MQEVTFEETLEQILAKDPRYQRDAYLFLREALDYTQKFVGKENSGKVRHVTGQELLDGIRQFALEQFGPMTLTVFEEWGVRNCSAFGELVFNMLEIGLLAKTEKDSRADFQGGYDFEDAFRKPFLPSGKTIGQHTSPLKS
ncbi:MAG: Minf_1886 family protein, partial [Verrucomicrobiota bacterium]